MSIDQCLAIAVKGGEIDQAQADEVRSLFERYVDQFTLAFGPADARARAQESLAKRLEAEATQRKRAALIQLETLQRVEQQVFSYRNARGEIDPAAALIALIEHHGQREKGFSSVEGRRKAIIAGAHADLEDMLHAHRRTVITGKTRNRARLEDVVREMLGEKTGDPEAKAFADAMSTVFERLRQRYNAQGGAIGKLEGGYLPQRHDGRAIRNAGFATWKKEIEQRLDWDRMKHHLTGDDIMPDERDEILDWVFDTLTTEGWAHRNPSMAPKGRGALVRQHAETRFLHFKSADDWLAYQKQFGEGDPFAAMMGHINLMARDIATMEILGPNPVATLEWLGQALQKEAAEAARGKPARFATRTELLGRRLRDPSSYARQSIHVAQRMFDVVRGNSDVAVNTLAADLSSGTRNVVTAASLQSAQLSALTDPIFGAVARRFAAGGTGAFGVASDTLTGLGDTVASMSTATRREAVRAGLILESAMHVMGEQARYAASQTGTARWLADRVLSWQGLNYWTQSGRHGFGLFMQGEFADQIATPWAKLKPQLARTLGRYGIDAIDWAFMQRASLHDLRMSSSSNAGAGANILRPREIQALGPASLVDAVTDETRVEARRFLADLDALAAKRKRVSLGEIADRARQFGSPELMDMIGRFNLADISEIRDFLGRVIGERRFEAGSVPSDAVDAKLARYTRTLGERYAEMILQETDYAVPQATVRSRVVLTGEGKPGTTTGELTRFFSQFKSFGVAVWLLHVHRIMRELAAGHVAGGAGYAGSILIGSTLLGGLVLQLKGFRDGKGVQDMHTSDFWVRAMMQGGGWGIWGDFVLADTNRFGGGWAQTLAGPTVGRVENIWNLTAGNLRQLATDKKTNFGRELVKAIDANLPGPGIWYTKLAWQRMVLDQLQILLDPEAAAAFRRRAAYARKQGTDYWWRPGERQPEFARR